MNDKNINTLNVEEMSKTFREYIAQSVKSKKCHDNINIMVYPNVGRVTGGKQVNIKKVIEDIRNKSERKQVSHKELLSAGYFAVAGFNGRKFDVNVTKHTGLIPIDIDKKDNPKTDFNKLKKDLQNNIYSYACFNSPSGGIKLIINTNISCNKHHDAYYHSIVKFLLRHYPALDKVDTSGSNIARALYLPYDSNAYFNPNAYKYCLDNKKVEEIISEVKLNALKKSSLKAILQVDSIGFDEHFKNIMKLVRSRTSVGLQLNKSLLDIGFMDMQKSISVYGNGAQTLVALFDDKTLVDLEGYKDKTSVGLVDDEKDEVIELYDNETLVGLYDIENNEFTDLVVNQDKTLVGLYDNIFNKYRYNNIERGVMSTYVSFWEFLILKNMIPYRLDYITRLDEYYFKNTQQPLSTDSIDGLDGLEICEVVLPSGHVIKEGFRHKTIGSISMKLIFNNPFCHPEYIIKEVQRINNSYCEDPNSFKNPKPDDEEVRNIVMNNYQSFLSGELDFSSVIRKSDKTKKVMKKYVFRSRYYVDICESNTHLKAIKTYAKGRRDKNNRKYLEAIEVLTDGTKITKKRIAEHIGLSIRQLGRYKNDEYDEMIKKYNKTLNNFN